MRHEKTKLMRSRNLLSSKRLGDIKGSEKLVSLYRLAMEATDESFLEAGTKSNMK